jgi:hypothetical protein
MRIAARCLMVIAVILSTATLSSTGFARGMHGAVRARGGGGVSGNLCGSGSALETSLAILDILIKPNESQKAAQQKWKVAAGRIDTYAPARPLAFGHDVITAIIEAFGHRVVSLNIRPPGQVREGKQLAAVFYIATIRKCCCIGIHYIHM